MRVVARFLLIVLALVGVITLTITGVGVWLIARQTEPKPLPEQVVLTLDLDRGVVERAPTGLLGRLQMDGAYPLREILDALDRAATDERVTGLLVRLRDGDLSMAKAQELRDAVTAFRESGKPALLFSESIGGDGNGTIAYYLATAFSQVWLQPSGDLSLAGFSLELPFLHDLLASLEIQPQFGARHEYKTAIESLTEKGMTPANRESIQALLDVWTNQVVEAVSSARGVPAETVRRLIDKAPLLPEEALAERLVDRLGYWDEAKAAMGDATEDLDTLAYLRRTDGPTGEAAKVALIYGLGTVQSRDEGTGPFDSSNVMSSETLTRALREATEDEDIKAILLRIDSPGGSYLASDTIWRAVRKAREAGKPVVVSMGGTAASGGYFVAMAADRIVAYPGTITGSIGVFAGKLVLRDFWEKLGVTWDGVKTGAHAGMWSFNQPFSESAWQRLQLQLDRIYGDFTGKVAEARHLDAAAIDRVARGRIWSGVDAHRLGLVDHLGGYRTALAVVREVAGLPQDARLDLQPFPERKSALAGLVEALRTGEVTETQVLIDGLRTLARLGEMFGPLLEQAGAGTQGELHAPLPLTTSGR